jgi:hypothetical protein
MKTGVSTSIKALLAPFETSYLSVKNKNPHTTGETLLLPVAIEMCEIIHGENYSQALKAVHLSNTMM